jgi:hypothetical protein
MKLMIATEIATQSLSLETKMKGWIGKGNARREVRERDVEDSF